MRRVWHFLLIFTVLWCGLHLGDADQAGSSSAVQVAQSLHVPGDDHGSPDGDGRHACHHHCPVAADMLTASGDDAPLPGRAALFAGPAVVLAALSRAPPLQPPST